MINYDNPLEEELERDVLHVAATRPAMVWGVPYMPIVMVVLACVEIELKLGFQMACFIDPPLALVVFGIVRHDYNAPRIWRAWAYTRARILDDWHWGGVAASAFPIKPAKRRFSFRTFRMKVSKQPRGVPSSEW